MTSQEGRTTRVECGECRVDLPTTAESPGGVPAPRWSCGSLRRHVFATAHLSATASLRASYHAKHPSPTYGNGSRSRPGLERWGGTPRGVDGVYRSVRRVVDRESDWYEEEVLNPDGSVHHYEAHRLSDHMDHGSAKPRTST